jgi:prolyl-tRNA editing enzyme YbaK/EbsC (Cys-tRNA(Pro) deacylase)
MAAVGNGAPGGSRERVAAGLAALGIDAEIREFSASTKTSAQAAEAVGCSVAQIAKSIVFRAPGSGRAVIVIASGASRVDERKVEALLGEAVGKADAAFVREATGFAIGGVAPLGHTGPVHLLIDEDLLALDPIWAAAGTPNAVFRIGADDLRRLPGARIAQVRLD